MISVHPGVLQHADPSCLPNWAGSSQLPTYPSAVHPRPSASQAGPPSTDNSPVRTILPRPCMFMLQCVYQGIIHHLTSVAPEAGGMLLGPKGSPVVSHYVPDRNGKATPVSFTLDAAGLNQILKQFLLCDMDAKGIVHSHPFGATRPSSGDLDYVRKVFSNDKNTELHTFLLPIVCGNNLYPYVVAGADLHQALPATLILI